MALPSLKTGIFLSLFSLFVPSPSFAAYNKVSFPTQDQRFLVALFKKADAKNKYVICLHGLRASKNEWTPLLDELAKNGWGFLAYDARGHGESSKIKDEKGAPAELYTFGPPGRGSPWEEMINDVGAAIHYLEKEQKVERKKIFLVGASLGANVCLNYVALTRPVGGMILLSPGLTYIGISTEKPVQKLGGTPVLLVASEVDPYAYSSSLQLKKLNPSLTFWSDVKAGHGVQMFDEKLLSRILGWLGQR